MVQYLDNNNKSYTAYWSEYAEGIIRSLELKKVSPKEYHGACPCCGGEDRFWISEYHGEIRVNCRKCEDYAGITKVLRDQGLLPKFESQKKVSLGKAHIAKEELANASIAKLSNNKELNIFKN